MPKNKPTVEAISALDLQPADTIREVSPDALKYYEEDLSGLELPREFVNRNENVLSVKSWDTRRRLSGKFGRFAVRTEDGGVIEPDVLLMGSTIGLTGFDRDGFLHSLRHYEFYDSVFSALVSRGVSTEQDLYVTAVDYGSTEIKLHKRGGVKAVSVGGRSLDYGRANAEVRASTCELFRTLLGGAVEVVNSDPEPRAHDQIIRPR